MDGNLADWYRAAELVPNHEEMVKRKTGIAAFVEECKRDWIVDLSQCFFGIALAGDAITAMQEAVFAADNAFAMKDNDIELRVLAAACLMEILDGANGIPSAFVLTCPAILGKREGLLVPDICLQASEFLDAMSLQLRGPANLATKKVSATKIDSEITGITEATPANTFNTAGEHITSALQTLHATVAGLVAKCNRLDRNQQVFREDSDVLWWMTGGHSRDIGQPFSEIDSTGVATVIGKELADLTYVRPGPFAAQAVLGRCLQPSGATSSLVSLSQLVNKTPAEWKRTWKESIGENPDLLKLCPVASAVAASVEVEGERKWQAPFEAATSVKSSLKLAPLDWAYQTYRECMLIEIMNGQR